jgi:hypothetical protein
LRLGSQSIKIAKTRFGCIFGCRSEWWRRLTACAAKATLSPHAGDGDPNPNSLGYAKVRHVEVSRPPDRLPDRRLARKVFRAGNSAARRRRPQRHQRVSLRDLVAGARWSGWPGGMMRPRNTFTESRDNQARRLKTGPTAARGSGSSRAFSTSAVSSPAAPLRRGLRYCKKCSRAKKRRGGPGSGPI